MKKKSATLSRAYALHCDRAKFRITDNDRFALLLRLSIFIILFTIVFIVLLPFTAISWNIWLPIVGVLTATGGSLFFYAYKRKTTWKIEIDRPKRRFLILCNQKPYPNDLITLSVIDRPMLGCALWLAIENGPALFIAGSRSRETVDELAKELVQLLAV